MAKNIDYRYTTYNGINVISVNNVLYKYNITDKKDPCKLCELKKECRSLDKTEGISLCEYELGFDNFYLSKL